MLFNPSHLTYIVLSPVLSALFALLNIATIYIFCRHMRISSLSIIVMVNICACDVFVCLISNTFYVVNLLHPVYAWSTGPVSCKIFKFVTMLTNIAQIYFLCILNADRIRRLIHSTSKQWTKRDGIFFVSIAWLVATLICVPRLILFDTESTTKYSTIDNTTKVVSYSCKPIGMNNARYTAVTISTFVLAYALPALFCTLNAVIKLHHKLALTFNRTGAFFMAIWTPFFVLSLVDLTQDLMKTDESRNVNFALRCTLLILGSAKPLLYLIFLDKFRNSIVLVARGRCVWSTSETDTPIPSKRKKQGRNCSNTNKLESAV